ncbi:MAG: amidohydrolase family protein [Aridibacter famidurans]|nr:amidohydrolase family protein [Aridibacter famidurans]
MKLLRTARFIFLVVFAAAGLVAAQPPFAVTFAITNVTVIPMDSERTIPNATVVVFDGKIAAVSQNGKVPAGAIVIDGRGKFLIPGLADMHAHLFSDYDFPEELARDELRVMLANGVTTVRLMIGTPEHIGLRDRINAGRLLGPTIYAASPQISGRSFGEIFNGYVATNAAEAREAVRRAKAARFDFIKLTFFISREVYDAVIDEAKKQKIRVIGHVDRQVGLEAALDAGQQVEHLDGYFEAMIPEGSGLAGSTSGVFVWRPEAWESLDVLDEKKIPELARLTAEKSLFTVPTLTFLKRAFGTGQTDEEIAESPDHGFIPDRIREEMGGPRAQFWKNPPAEARRKKYVEYRNKLVKAIHDAGGKVMAGSDAPEWFLLYGYTLHRELESLREAGLSNYAVLESATRHPAEFLGELDSAGTIEPGKRADLVLLDADPLKDISSTRKITGVMVRGQWFSKEAIDATLEEIRPRFRAAFDKRPKLLDDDPSLQGGVYRGSFTPDGETLYFFKRTAPQGEQYRIFRTSRKEGKWGPAEMIDLGGDFSDLYPAISNDGQRMVFASYRPVAGDTSDKPNSHLWMAERDGDGWGKPKFLGSVNKLGDYHSWVEFGWDGDLFFRRTTPDWRNTVTLHAKWNGEGFDAPEPFAEVEQIIRSTPGLNSSGGSPGPTNDLIFIDAGARDPLTGRGTSDIYVSRKMDGKWSEAKPFGPTINIGGFDVFPFVSPDGKTMYFVRDFERFYSIELDAAMRTIEW